MYLEGIGVSSGIEIGKAFIIQESEPQVLKSLEDPSEEIKRLENAVYKFAEIIRRRAGQVSGEQADILRSYGDMLEDSVLLEEIHDLIKSENCNCEYAVDVIFDQYIQIFESSASGVLELRSSDLRDIKNNLITVLEGKPVFDAASLPEGSIIVAKELAATIAAGIDPRCIKAIVTQEGGKTSHMVIIARSLGIPAVTGINITCVRQNDDLIVDGEAGIVYINASEEQTKELQAKKAVFEEKQSEFKKYRGMKSVTPDGKKIELFANIGLDMDIENAVRADAEGIGLFRTEFLYMNRRTPPSEAEQFHIYKKAAIYFRDQPVIIRTLDIGGDKEVPYLEMEKEENPFLGWRAIRYCLDRKELFIVQIRAILKASIFGKIKIMIPMISTVSEWNETICIIEEVKEQLASEAVLFNKYIEIGMMIETPAGAVLADVFAKKADFFSIGTNDLTQYIMAADRGNKKVASLYNVCDPAVMRLIYHTAQAAEWNNIACGICGEAGGDPLFVKFLIGCGVTELSMSGGAILMVREIIRNSSYERLSRFVADKILDLETAEESKHFLEQLNSVN